MTFDFSLKCRLINSLTEFSQTHQQRFFYKKRLEIHANDQDKNLGRRHTLKTKMTLVDFFEDNTGIVSTETKGITECSIYGSLASSMEGEIKPWV